MRLALTSFLLIALGCRHAPEPPREPTAPADPGTRRAPTGPVTVGDAAPEFSLPAVGGKTVALASLLERGPAVVVFYRGHW